MSEVFVNDLLVKTIDNNRGKKAEFFYDDDNGSVVGGKLCSKILILKNGEATVNDNDLLYPYKGWRFEYDTPSTTQTARTCGIPDSSKVTASLTFSATAQDYYQGAESDGKAVATNFTLQAHVYKHFYLYTCL